MTRITTTTGQFQTTLYHMGTCWTRNLPEAYDGVVAKLVSSHGDGTRQYIIWDTIGKCQIGTTYHNFRRAHTRANKLDLQYGGYRYTVRNK